MGTAGAVRSPELIWRKARIVVGAAPIAASGSRERSLHCSFKAARAVLGGLGQLPGALPLILSSNGSANHGDTGCAALASDVMVGKGNCGSARRKANAALLGADRPYSRRSPSLLPASMCRAVGLQRTGHSTATLSALSLAAPVSQSDASISAPLLDTSSQL